MIGTETGTEIKYERYICEIERGRETKRQSDFSLHELELRIYIISVHNGSAVHNTSTGGYPSNLQYSQYSQVLDVLFSITVVLIYDGSSESTKSMYGVQNIILSVLGICRFSIYIFNRKTYRQYISSNLNSRIPGAFV